MSSGSNAGPPEVSRPDSPPPAFDQDQDTMGGPITNAKPDKPVAPTTVKQFTSCLLYGFISVLLSMVTKALFTVYGFRFPFFVLSLQLAFSLCITSLMKTFPQYSPTPMPPMNWETLRESVPQSALFVLNVIVSFQGMARVNIPLFLCLRRTTLAFVMLGEIVVLGQSFKRSTKLCVGLIVMGAVVAGWDSLMTAAAEATPTAFAYVVANNLCTALFLTLSKRFTNKHNIKGFGLVFYQSLVGLPIALAACFAFGEPAGLATFEGWSSPSFQLWLVCSGMLGLAIVYAILVANTLNSPLTIGVTGAIKDIAASGFSLLVFAGFKATFFTMLGLTMSFVGTLSYAVEKGLAAQQGKKAPVDDEPLKPSRKTVEV